MKTLVNIFLISILLVKVSYAATNFCQDASAKGCWLMEDTGDESDESGNGETLTQTSGTIDVNTSDFKFGLASRDFEDADTEYLTHADGGSTEINGANAQITMAVWIKPEALPGSSFTTWIMAKYNSTGNQRQYGLLLDSANSDRLGFNLDDDGAGAVDVDSAVAPTAGAWTHVMVTSDDVTMKMYVNCVLEADTQSHTAGIFNSTAPFTIGINGGISASSYYDGLIDDAIILSRAATVAECIEMMNCGVTGEGTSPSCQRAIQGSTLQGATIN